MVSKRTVAVSGITIAASPVCPAEVLYVPDVALPRLEAASGQSETSEVIAWRPAVPVSRCGPTPGIASRAGAGRSASRNCRGRGASKPG